jgi:hypothetical protein
VKRSGWRGRLGRCCGSLRDRAVRAAPGEDEEHDTERKVVCGVAPRRSGVKVHSLFLSDRGGSVTTGRGEGRAAPLPLQFLRCMHEDRSGAFRRAGRTPALARIRLRRPVLGEYIGRIAAAP